MREGFAFDRSSLASKDCSMSATAFRVNSAVAIEIMRPVDKNPIANCNPFQSIKGWWAWLISNTNGTIMDQTNIRLPNRRMCSPETMPMIRKPITWLICIIICREPTLTGIPKCALASDVNPSKTTNVLKDYKKFFI